MRLRWAALLVWCLLLLAAAVHALYYYPKLPAVTASHFGLRGDPDAWLAKESFFKIYAITFGGLSLFLLAMSLGVRVMPAGLLRMPSKDYWLAPQRRAESLSYVSQSTLWISNATMLLLIATADGAFRANLAPRVRMPADFWGWLAAYLLFVVAVGVRLHLRFRRRNGRISGGAGDAT